MSCEIVRERAGIHCRYFGHVRKEEMDQVAYSIQVDVNSPLIRYVIADFSDITRWDITEYDALILAYHDHHTYSQNTTLRIALIAPVGEVASIMNRYANSPLMTFHVKIFESLSDARDWIGS